ncbi:alpha/beta hydrolase [Anaerovibrio sp.]|uniref:alpha/beta hydrolase n=1 Tax=Anaerovibrio sp. TaxID=1872532 RepID=UPI0025C07561|nr:alpha/beta hydrolase [Anaerovibrio sp.]MBR2142025.1 alpha/beta hydrolase [Anaerovibrio sp.]
MMNYNWKKRWGIVAIVFIAVVLTAGYAIGDYFVDYALKRGSDTDPLAPPAACVNILDKSREMPKEPAVPTEEWSMTMPDGRNVVAVNYRPAQTGHRWVILAHGYGRDHRYVRDYAEVYLKQGYHVLSPDLCAAGESEGKYITMGVKESEEIAKWAAKVKECDNDAEIVLHGISMGAATVMLAAGRYEIPGLAAVIEDCGYTSAYDMFTNQLDVIFGLPEFPIMKCVDIVSGIKTGVKVSDAAPIKAVPDIKVPVMFIHGTADKLVPPSMMEKLYNACPASKSKFVVEGAGHGDAMTVAGKEYWKAVFSFLDEFLATKSISG